MNTYRLRDTLALCCAFLLATFVLSDATAGPQKLYGYQFLLPSKALNGSDNPFYVYDPDDPALKQLVIDEPEHPLEVVVKFVNKSPPSTGASNPASLRFDMVGLEVTFVSVPRGMPSFTYNPVTNTSTVTVTNISPPIKGGDSNAFRVTLRVKSCVAKFDVYVPHLSPNLLVSTGSQLFNGEPFGLASFDEELRRESASFVVGDITGISCGTIGCGPEAVFVIANSQATKDNATCSLYTTGNAECVTVARGSDTNGACTPGVSYFATNNLDTGFVETNKMHFVWETETAPAAFALETEIAPAAFAYLVTFPFPFPFPEGTSVKVAWVEGTDGPKYIPAPTCRPLQPPMTALPFGLLPWQYATLDNDVKVNSTTIKVTLLPGVSVPTPPFPIVIDDERLLVTAINNNSWDVTRGDGGTDPATHFKDGKVMFTALPKLEVDYSNIDPAYALGKKAKMCLTGVADNLDGTSSGWMLDSGDGYMRW